MASCSTWGFLLLLLLLATGCFHLAWCFQGSSMLFQVCLSFFIIALLVGVKWYLIVALSCRFLDEFRFLLPPPPPTETSWGQGSDSKSQVPTIMPGKYLIKSYLVNDWFCHISGPFKVKMWFSTYKLIFILPWAKQLEGVSPPPLGKSCVNLTAQ